MKSKICSVTRMKCLKEKVGWIVGREEGKGLSGEDVE